MYTLIFETFAGRLFLIDSKNYPLPRTGDIVTYNKKDYRVYMVRHRFADLEGVESTSIVITLEESVECVMPLSALLSPTDFASSTEQQ